MDKMKLAKWLIFIAWLQALIAMAGSLYASEVAGLAPCVLCWYQRIALYPAVVILAVALWKRDTLVARYVLPLTAIGGVIAIYHSLLQWKVIPEALGTCQFGVSCSVATFSLFHFITLPFLSLIGFLVITVCVAWAHKLMNSTISGKTQRVTS